MRGWRWLLLAMLPLIALFMWLMTSGEPRTFPGPEPRPGPLEEGAAREGPAARPAPEGAGRDARLAPRSDAPAPPSPLGLDAPDPAELARWPVIASGWLSDAQRVAHACSSDRDCGTWERCRLGVCMNRGGPCAADGDCGYSLEGRSTSLGSQNRTEPSSRANVSIVVVFTPAM